MKRSVFILIAIGMFSISGQVAPYAGAKPKISQENQDMVEQLQAIEEAEALDCGAVTGLASVAMSQQGYKKRSVQLKYYSEIWDEVLRLKADGNQVDYQSGKFMKMLGDKSQSQDSKLEYLTLKVLECDEMIADAQKKIDSANAVAGR